METVKQTMAQKNLLVLLVAAFAMFALFAGNVSAFGTITDVEVNGVDAVGTGVDLGQFAGQRVPILVTFEADAPTDPSYPEVYEDVRFKVWLSGERENAAVTERFDVIAGRTYSRFVFLDVPFDLDDELDESRSLEIVVENKKEGTADEVAVDLTVQRESYKLEILSVNLDAEVKAGDTVVVDVVLKNRGRQEADDTFLRIKIPELGIETKTYFGDLSPLDEEDFDNDAVQRFSSLRIPVDAAAGLYTVELEAWNSDSIDRAERRVLVTGAGQEAMVVSSVGTKTVAPSEEAEFKLTVVNRGNVVGIYEVILNAPTNLNIDVSDAVIVVPAGSSRTLSIFADSKEAGQYSFTASVRAEDGELVGEKTFRANVEKDGRGVSAVSGDNVTVLLTVILVIIFVVLLVVLIVLLTRKPDKSEEFGESYY